MFYESAVILLPLFTAIFLLALTAAYAGRPLSNCSSNNSIAVAGKILILYGVQRDVKCTKHVKSLTSNTAVFMTINNSHTVLRTEDVTVGKAPITTGER